MSDQDDQNDQSGQNDTWLEGLGVTWFQKQDDAGSTSNAPLAQSVQADSDAPPTPSDSGGTSGAQALGQTTGQTTAPTISATSKGDGSFSITGSGFLENNV